MSTVGLSAGALTALGNDGASVAMRWLEMLLPESAAVKAGLPAYSLRVIEDPTNNVVRNIKEPLNLISVMGPARSGKSTLMNLLAGCKVTELFPTSPGMETFTKGIFIPTRMLSLPEFSALEGDPPVQSSDSNIKVTFVDTEGQGALGTSYDMSLFSPVLISSRVVIYNRTGGLLVEEIINQLGMMTQAAQKLRIASNDSSGAIFGHLFIVFNQFRLNRTDTAATLQATLVNDEKETDTSSQNRNAIRALLRSSFESIQVYILPDQLKDESRDALADGTKSFLLLDDFRPKYLEYFKVLRLGLSQALVRPRELSKGTALTGGALADFMPQFTAAINKAEPLNIPSIFEAAQNGAINKAISAFSVGLTKSLDARLADPPRTTVMLGTLIDTDITLLLAQLASTLSYMPQTTVQKAQEEARKQTAGPKTSALAVNLTRLRGVMATNINDSITNLRSVVDGMFQGVDGQVSQAEAEARLSSLESSKVSSIEATGNSYDPQSFPDGWRQSFADAVAAMKPAVMVRISAAWALWITNLKDSKMQALTTALISLGESKGVGQGNAYAREALTLTQDAKDQLNGQLDSSYRWNDKVDQKAQFATMVDNAAQTRRALWDKNEADVRAQLDTLTKRLLAQYEKRLRDSLVPQIEPAEYFTITDDTDLENQLNTFLSNNKISASLASDTVFQFQDAISLKKSKFNSAYTKATNDYRDYLVGEFSRLLPPILAQYRTNVDSIVLDLTSSAITRASVSAQCDGYQTQARQSLKTSTSTLGIKSSGGSVSASVVDTQSAQLEDSIRLGKSEKLDKYDEIVGVYNKTLLAGIIQPVVDKALANSYPNDGALDGDVDNANATFRDKARGDGADRLTKWNNWYTSIYPLVLETVQRYNAYNVPGLDGNTAATKEIQTAASHDSAEMANILGMSYINSGLLDPNAVEDLGLSQPDPSKPGYQASRTLRLNNNFQDSSWFDISDIVWGKPIITDLKPSKASHVIDTSEFPAQPTAGSVTVGTNSSEISTITDSYNWGVGVALEAGYKQGVKDVWEANVKTTFNAQFNATNTKSATTQYSTSISTSLALPANRVNVVSQMIFNQRTSLPYTAKVRVVPRLRFENGFTRWGGDGNYQSNPKTSALKPAYRKGDRTYDRQEFTRCDEIRADARADRDPWYWKLAMQRNPALSAYLDDLADPTRYEVYVKGKWEGITGKYTVTTVTPKTTAASLMPTF